MTRYLSKFANKIKWLNIFLKQVPLASGTEVYSTKRCSFPCRYETMNQRIHSVFLNAH
ncbi:hypothetical protein LDG_7407 [Legionella drancourtii LLAP12]|uniref:Uncharacterized protein n=1 Tax=Legionella drancourtii LLAP12 TaxID=658187 RepID=G9EQ61_9GAMM|nr:hypothetical protein LDG_7407 [Legionella drancourtii LLAP12]